jgi:hypothetical protein
LIVAELRPSEIRDYVKSLKASAVHWFATFYPELTDGPTRSETEWIQRLNRLGMAYFRPLVMAILKKVDVASERVGILKGIRKRDRAAYLNSEHPRPHRPPSVIRRFRRAAIPSFTTGRVRLPHRLRPRHANRPM